MHLQVRRHCAVPPNCSRRVGRRVDSPPGKWRLISGRARRSGLGTVALAGLHVCGALAFAEAASSVRHIRVLAARKHTGKRWLRWQRQRLQRRHPWRELRQRRCERACIVEAALRCRRVELHDDFGWRRARRRRGRVRAPDQRGPVGLIDDVGSLGTHISIMMPHSRQSGTHRASRVPWIVGTLCGVLSITLHAPPG